MPLAGVVAGWSPAAIAQLPTLDPPELRCQQATINQATDFLDASLSARQTCLQAQLNGKLPATVNCLASTGRDSGDPATDTRLRSAETRLAQSIAGNCTGVNFAALGFPGTCPDPDGGAFDALNQANCLITKINETLALVLPIEYAPLPIGFGELRDRDRTCQEDFATKAGRLLFREFRGRATCISRQFEGRADPTADCRAEMSRDVPATGDPQTDSDVLAAHKKVLTGVAESCSGIDLSDLGAPNMCPHPAGSVFGLAQLVECLFETHHPEAFRLLDVVTPWGSTCGNGIVDSPPEQCDDGDQTFNRGEACTADCRATMCGDPNGNRVINITDSLMVLRSAIGVFPCAAQVCDVNGDGKENSSDGLILLRRSVGQTVSTNCPR